MGHKGTQKSTFSYFSGLGVPDSKKVAKYFFSLGGFGLQNRTKKCQQHEVSPRRNANSSNFSRLDFEGLFDGKARLEVLRLGGGGGMPRTIRGDSSPGSEIEISLPPRVAYMRS